MQSTPHLQGSQPPFTISIMSYRRTCNEFSPSIHPSVFHSPHFGSRVSWSLSQLTGFGLREEARDTRRKPTEAQGETCKVHSRKARDEIQMPNLRIIQAVFEVTLCKLATSQDHKFGGHNSHLLGSKYHHSGFKIKQTKCALTTDVRF